MKAITVLLYRNYANMFVIECFSEDNKIISGIESTFTESDLKKTDFQPIYGCQGL